MADNKAVHSRHVHEGPNASGASCCGGGYVARDQGGHGVHQGHDHHGPHDDQRHDHGGSAAPKDAEHRVKDPVCGMWVDPHTTKHRAEHNGQPYYFCSAGCREKFLADPLRYLDPAVAAAKAEPVPEGTIYTCPMHPEVRQVGPGSCPICGMALEPVLVSLDAEPNHELVDMTRRFWIGLALSLPVFALEMGGHLIGLDHLISPQTSNWIQLLLATPVVLWCGWPFFVRGWQSLVTRNLNMFTLIAMGTGVAWVYSVVATLAPGVFPAAFRNPDGSVAVYFEAAAVITVLVLLGQVLELRARESTSGAIRALLDLAPKTRTPHPPGRNRGGGAARQRPCRRPPARAPGREGASGRRCRRRAQRRRRIHGHGRVDAGDEGGRREGHRRHHEPERRARHRGAQGRARHHAVADRAACRGSAALAARRSSASPTRSRGGSCRR